MVNKLQFAGGWLFEATKLLLLRRLLAFFKPIFEAAGFAVL
jgi:hypothetical protein